MPLSQRLLTILLFPLLTVVNSCSDRGVKTEQPSPTTGSTDTSGFWYKRAVIYNLDVEAFKDSDQDGTGDFKGLISSMGYLDSLGVTTIWLSPFQPTPNKDDGYDISDYYAVDSRLGTMADFEVFMRTAREHHIRVIIDLVVNHTSDKHPWFTSARSSKNSPYRNWYYWSATKPSNYDVGMVFPGVQESVWTMDSISHEYYYHRFYDFQPDLNMQNPAVFREVENITSFWMQKGIDGFRVDAVPFFIEVPNTKSDNFDHQFELITRMRSLLDSLDDDAIILGEANVPPDESIDYFGKNGDGLNMMLNFYVNQHLFYALATADTRSLEKALEQTRQMPHDAEWGQFLRNHDEVDLGRLSDEDRQKVYEAFGPEKHMQLYDRGIRRRLAPMLKNNKARIELAYSLMFALPGTPVIRYGDELGMGDDLRLKERLAVRTPMQWSSAINAGFTRNSKPVLPVIDFGEFDYRKVNVATQQTDKASLLSFTQQLIRARRNCPEIAFGDWEKVHTGFSHIVGIRYKLNDGEVIVLHNLAPQRAAFDISTGSHTLTKLLSSAGQFKQDGDKGHVDLDAYGFLWLASPRQ